MEHYQHILLATDYSKPCHLVAEKAKQIAHLYNAKLSLLHILDNIPMPQMQYGTVIPLTAKTDNAALEAEKSQLMHLGEELGISAENRWLVWGLPAREIALFAQQINADLILVGSHEHQGITLLWDSIANGVLQHAGCDVLSVRL